MGFHERGEGPRTKSIAELAQNNKYFDNSTGTWSNKTINELGPIGVLASDTLVLAQYDQDVYENGVLTHKKGDFKFDDEGKFYYETLNGREFYGKQTLGVFDVLTTDGST